MNTCERCRGVWAISFCLVVAAAILSVSLFIGVHFQEEDITKRELAVTERERDVAHAELTKIGRLDNRLLRADAYLKKIEDDAKRAEARANPKSEIDKKRGGK